jgi:LuxR family transcriptional regulator, maltose regulon positive regulatory protein
LKALACAGGKGITESQLIDWFWPESEADAARKALDISLHRLRALLGSVEFVKVGDGRIGLDRSRVWVDAWAFEAASGHAGLDDTRSTEETAGLYRGALLPEDVDAVWSVSYREKLRDSFNRMIRTRAENLEAKRDYAEALRWYARGLEADDLAEAMYQGMMRCQLGMGCPADTLATYQRLRRTLTTSSNVDQALINDLGASFGRDVRAQIRGRLTDGIDKFSAPRQSGRVGRTRRTADRRARRLMHHGRCPAYVSRPI